MCWHTGKQHRTGNCWLNPNKQNLTPQHQAAGSLLSCLLTGSDTFRYFSLPYITRILIVFLYSLAASTNCSAWKWLFAFIRAHLFWVGGRDSPFYFPCTPIHVVCKQPAPAALASRYKCHQKPEAGTCPLAKNSLYHNWLKVLQLYAKPWTKFQLSQYRRGTMNTVVTPWDCPVIASYLTQIKTAMPQFFTCKSNYKPSMVFWEEIHEGL